MAFNIMRFCKECDNMLQPKEQRLENGTARLIYDCRICLNYEVAKEGDENENCVYKSETLKVSGGEIKIDRECIKDPTLSRNRNIKCKNCMHHEAVTFTNPTKEKMELIFVCTSCKNSWKKEEDEKDEVKELGLEKEQSMLL